MCVNSGGQLFGYPSQRHVALAAPATVVVASLSPILATAAGPTTMSILFGPDLSLEFPTLAAVSLCGLWQVSRKGFCLTPLLLLSNIEGEGQGVHSNFPGGKGSREPNACREFADGVVRVAGHG